MCAGSAKGQEAEEGEGRPYLEDPEGEHEGEEEEEHEHEDCQGLDPDVDLQAIATVAKGMARHPSGTVWRATRWWWRRTTPSS